MRLKTLKTIAVLMIIAIGFMVAEPFVDETAEADCGFYPMTYCFAAMMNCVYKTEWADFNCPGANDAGLQRCIELTEAAEKACEEADFICYHADW